MQSSESLIPRFPVRMSRKELYPQAYRLMYLSRKLDELFLELFKKRYVKGTVILSTGNEATTIGIALPFRPGSDIVSFLHRDLGCHLAQDASPYSLICQYMANAESPTHGREGNVHHGNAHLRRFPMISHLGNMLATVVGGVWAAHRQGEKVFGLATIGDGGSSTGDFHEAVNLAAVVKTPVLFVIENNQYAFSTPVSKQFACKRLSDRALGYGIAGKTIDGTDVGEVYDAVCDSLEYMQSANAPFLLESMTLRASGHAAYDDASYVSEKEKKSWIEKDPLVKARAQLQIVNNFSEQRIQAIERQIDDEIRAASQKALRVSRPAYDVSALSIYAKPEAVSCKPFAASKQKNLSAVTLALHYILSHHPDAFVVGQDVGVYGSAFKTCKGLIDAFGAERVIDFPICESATVGFCLGASQTGGKPIMEFQFADFSTEVVTSLGLNAATWFYRSGKAAPMLLRMPVGGGITLGAFHSAECDGLWTRFPGLKILYPVTPQETFEALVAGFYDPNPCIVFEHKRLYASSNGDISFEGNLQEIWQPRCYTTGDDVTVVALGSSVLLARNVIETNGLSAELWNPFIIAPLNLDPIIDSVMRTGKLVIIQEGTSTAGLGNCVFSIVTRACFGRLKKAPVVISAADIPVPFAPELENEYLPSAEKIKDVIISMIGDARGH